jgi:hypothetical protein
MVVSYRDKRSERFAAGENVRQFSGFARQAETRLDRLDAATSLADLAAGQSDRGLEGRSRGPVFDPDQRSMADLLQLARGLAGAG